MVTSQNDPFFALGKWKMPFWCDKKENILLQHCLPCHDAHVFTIWPYYHKLCLDSSHNIGHLTRKPRNLERDRSFCEGFFGHNQYTKFDIFPFTVSHKMTPREKSTLFGQLLNILRQFQTMVKTTGMKVLS